MNLPPKNNFAKVALITFGATLFYWSFGVYLIHLLPYQHGFQPASEVYAKSGLFFFGLVALSNLYTVIAFIRAKWSRKEMHPIIAIGPAISLTLMIIWNIKPYIPSFLPTGSHLQSFNSELWIADDSTIAREGITVRQKMLGDVTENILPGKSRNKIIRLLGLSSDDSLQPTLRFYLGPARGAFFGEVEWLNVYLDHSGHFKNYEVFRED
jgi:hypothetical protein